MHVPGCKTWHTHGAAGRKVAGKSSGTRRNPASARPEVFIAREQASKRKIAAIHRLEAYWNLGLPKNDPRLIAAQNEYEDANMALRKAEERLRAWYGKKP